MPRADTFCDMHIESNPVPTKLNPLGAKGAGEAGTVGALPAVINAVHETRWPRSACATSTCRPRASGCGRPSRTPPASALIGALTRTSGDRPCGRRSTTRS